MTKGFLYFFLGLLAIMGVVGGIEQTVDISLFQGIQLFVVTLIGLGYMIVGVSYMKEIE